ncbi:MAG: RhuM family protein [Bacilli bacterium]
MIYTKIIREYIEQNDGMIFEIAKEHKEHFPMVPYKTFCKILNRIEEEGLIYKLSFGTYGVGDCSKKKSNATIRDFYTHDDHGFTLGNYFLKSLGITPILGEKDLILTNLLEAKQVDYKKYKVCRMNIIPFTEYHKSLLGILYLIEIGPKLSLDDSVIKSRYILTHLNEYLDVAELNALSQIPMKMTDWVNEIDGFLKMTRKEILNTKGTISYKEA